MSVTGKLEPLFWWLFGIGGMAAAMLLPALFFIFAFAFPLGWFGTPAESFERLRLIIANPVGKLVLSVVISAIFWHAAHHIRHFLYDVGLHHAQSLIAGVLYGLAIVGTVAAFGVIGQL